MQALDYQRLANKAKSNLFNDSSISKKNKEITKDFLLNYHTSPARLQITMTHLRVFLQKTNDIKKDMHNEKPMDGIYRAIYKEKPGYFETIRNVSRMFCRRVNGDKLPRAIEKALKKIPKKENKRDLDEDKLMTWADCQNMISKTNSIQFKAMIPFQLSAGLRPSELVNLNYGDIKQQGDFIVITVRTSKTGKRKFPDWRSVPYMLKWMQAHPTKNDNDPLWLQEFNTSREIKRYEYPAILKRVKEIVELAKINKPVDFYSLRHSSCALDKLENLPLDIAASRHGHSVKYFVEVYGQIGIEGTIERIKRHNGMDEQETKKAEQNITCSRCNSSNVPKADICEQCGTALSVKKALEIEESKNKEMELVKNQLSAMQEQMKEQIKMFNSFVKNPKISSI